MPEPAPTPSASAAAATTPPAGSRRRLVLAIAVGIGLAVLFFFGLRYLVEVFTHEDTDDAFIETGVVSIAPKVAGIVAAVHVRDNQWVNAGDPLVDIDARDYETALARKQASLSVAQSNKKSAEAAYQVMQAKLATAEATAKQSASESAASQATADKADADLKRAETLREQKVLSQQEYDQIRATALTTAATAAADRDKARSDESKVNEARAQLDAVVAALEMVQSQIAEAQTEVKSANLDLSYTRIYAPTNGAVTRKSVQEGEYVQAGQKLLAIVPSNVWVIANFKETQLDHIRPGMPVKIHVDAYPEQALRGHVDSVQAGSGARFSLLPPENAVGNFVKVVQRVPVKILFDDAPDTTHTLGPGMSVVPSVRTRDFAPPEALLAVAAVVLAALGTWLGLKALPDREEKTNS
jgi:membrane fusion protein (multidrug efflux system)